MSEPLFDREELVNRMARMQSGLVEQGFHGAVLVQRADVLYYTGAAFQGALLVPSEGEPSVFAWRAAGRIGPECPAQVREVSSLGQALRAIGESDFRTWTKIGTEEDVLPVAMWRQFSMLWPQATFADVSALVKWQRAVKSSTELRYLDEAARIACVAYAELKDVLQEGMPENAVQMELDRLLRTRGHQGFFRIRGFNGEALGIVACGESANAAGVFDGPIGEVGVSPAAPVGASTRPLMRNTPILIDAGAVYNGYHADITRIYSLGQIAPQLQRAHDFCCDVLEEVAARLRPGAIPREIYEFALVRAEQSGYRDEFMNRGALKARFIGHGVGLELDEWPVLTKSFAQPLERNMVLAVEPKIVFAAGAVGVEDTFLVTERGGRAITQMDRHVIRVDLAKVESVQ
jgi:Xaa-Pro aminopeptidase